MEDHGPSFSPPLPLPGRVTMGDALVRSRIVSKKGDAAVLMGIFALVCIAASIYFLAVAAPKGPTPLGRDVLRSGETIPSYVQ